MIISKESLNTSKLSFPDNLKLAENQSKLGLQDHPQFICKAKEMDIARQKLIELLVQDPDSLHILADQFLLQIEQGQTQSEMLSINNGKYNSKVVQDNHSVQLNAKQFEIQLCAIFQNIISGHKIDDLTFLMQIHFLPAFLQHVSTRVIKETESTANRTCILKQISLMTNLREDLVQSNLRLVTFIANKYSHHKLTFADLIQEGTIGLIKAVDRFDTNHYVKFSTYAVYWIRQTISRCITRQKNTIRLPYNLAPKASEVFDVINKHLEQTNRYPSTSEIARSCLLSTGEVEGILKSYQPEISLTAHVNNEQEMPLLIDSLEQQQFPSPFNSISRSGLQITLKRAISSLSKREAYILCARYGINNSIELTLQDLAEHFQVSSERVRQIQNNALRRIKAEYSSELSDYLTPELCSE